jgi:hypothetical protein
MKLIVSISFKMKRTSLPPNIGGVLGPSLSTHAKKRRSLRFLIAKAQT